MNALCDASEYEVTGATAAALAQPAPVGHPISYATSVGQPRLPLRLPV